MYTAWTKHIKDPEKKEDFERIIKSSKETLNRLTDLLDEEENSLERSELDIRTFDQPNWEYKQAYKNGYRSCLRFLKTLIDLDQQEHAQNDPGKSTGR